MATVRFQIIRNARIEYVGKSQSCMVSKLRIIWKQTVASPAGGAGAGQPDIEEEIDDVHAEIARLKAEMGL